MGRTSVCMCWVVMAICLAAHASATAASRRTALVIGNAAYQEGRLRNPGHDATDMAAMLKPLGFDVALLLDADLRSMEDAIDDFNRRLRQGGVGLFYYAGHGVQVQGENYLIPLKAHVERAQDVRYEAVALGRVLGAMEDAANEVNIVILDACRNNPFARQWRSTTSGLAPIQAVRGSLIAYATEPGGVAIDGDGRNGLYTSHLLQYMSTPGLSIEHMFKRVRAAVVNTTNGRQTPWESSSLIGAFSFNPVAGTPPKIAARPSEPVSPSVTSGAPDPEAEMWELIKETTHPEDIESFLTAFPEGRFAPHARLKLRQLRRQPTGKKPAPAGLSAAEEQQKLAAERRRLDAERKRLEARRKRLAAEKGQADRVEQSSEKAKAQQPSKVARLEAKPHQRAEPIGRFIKYANGTVLDTRTQLMWMAQDFRNLEGRAPDDWEEAMAWATKINQQRYGGHSDWRVPTEEEYRTIYDQNRNKKSYAGRPVGYPEAFEDGGGEWFWTRELIFRHNDGEFRTDEDLREMGLADAYGFNFQKGKLHVHKMTFTYHRLSVRLVRRGP